MATTRYFFQASQEHFPPEDLLAQAVEAIGVYGAQVLPALRGARVA
jgi:hypothetical protein